MSRYSYDEYFVFLVLVRDMAIGRRDCSESLEEFNLLKTGVIKWSYYREVHKILGGTNYSLKKMQKIGVLKLGIKFTTFLNDFKRW